MRIAELWDKLEPLVQNKIDKVLGSVAYGDKIFSGAAAATSGPNLFKTDQTFNDAVILNSYLVFKRTNKLNIDAATQSADVTLMLPDGDGTNGQVLKTDGAGNLSWASFAVEGHTHKFDLEVVIGDGINAITTGSKGYLRVPRACTVSAWYIYADAIGSIVIDVKRCTHAGFPTTSSIAGTEKPTLSSAQKNADMSLTTWTTSLAEGDILEFVVDSASTVKQVTLAIAVEG